MIGAPSTFIPPDGFRYDLSEWPICVTFRLDSPTDQAYVAHLKNLDAMFAEMVKQVHIIDAGDGPRTRQTQLKMQAAWNDRNRDVLARNCLGIGMVLRNPIRRLGIGTVLAFMQHPVPYQVFGGLEPALAWARGRVGTHRHAPKRSE